MSTDEDLLLLLVFVFDRFMGSVPPESMLLNAIADWRIKDGAS
jgi:hypothetical protein